MFPLINQGRDSTIEPAYLAEKKEVIPESNLIELDVTPTSEAQTITPESPVDGYSSVSVSAVTSAIDENIVAGNIKKDVTILGVTGSYEGSGGGSGNTTLSAESAINYTSDYATLLTSISIPGSVSTISDNSFYECVNLADVTIPNGVTLIDSYAFYGCSSLSEITIPSSVTTLGSYAFKGCTALAEVNLSNGIETIGDNAFAECTALLSITIPSSVTSIDSSAFMDCDNLTSITVNKAEGSISDAPWGATNATVVWNG